MVAQRNDWDYGPSRNDRTSRNIPASQDADHSPHSQAKHSQQWMSVEDFLALDREHLDQKYELINGQMVAMAGGSTNHTFLIGNLQGLLHFQLRKRRCSSFAEGTLKIGAECRMPDIMVTCNERDLTENKTYIEHPKLVIEVLSPSTEIEDRREKLLMYTRCPSIQEYALVNWDCMLVQKMTRKSTEDSDDIQWLDQWYGPGEQIHLESIDVVLATDDIYEKVTLPPFDPLRRRNRPSVQS
jgi:Uma2 family endonuclease